MTWCLLLPLLTGNGQRAARDWSTAHSRTPDLPPARLLSLSARPSSPNQAFKERPALPLGAVLRPHALPTALSLCTGKGAVTRQGPAHTRAACAPAPGQAPECAPAQPRVSAALLPSPHLGWSPFSPACVQGVPPGGSRGLGGEKKVVQAVFSCSPALRPLIDRNAKPGRLESVFEHCPQACVLRPLPRVCGLQTGPLPAQVRMLPPALGRT